MKYRRLLRDDEQLLFDVRRHVLGCGFEVFVGLVAIVALGYGFLSWGTAPHWVHLGFLYASAIVFVVTALRVSLYHSHHLILTSDRLIIRSGFLRRSRTDLSLNRLTSVTTHQRFRERLVGKGALEVSIADSTESLVVHDVRRPVQVAREISAAIDAAPGRAASIALPQRNTAAELLGRLQRLHQRGAITDDEFAERSADLSP